MDCPECGSDAENANFCPECGNDLRGLTDDDADPGACPECGAHAGDARFCPECGHQLKEGTSAPPPTPVRRPPAPRASAPAVDSSGKNRQQRRQAERRAAQRSAPRSHPAAASGRAAGPSRFNTTWLIWGGFAVAAIVVALIIVGVGGGGGGDSNAATGSAATTTPTVTADTSGSYSELVARANGLYDQGSAAFKKNDTAGGQKYFATAAKVYAAAWKKQAGDASVGTDYATSLFYSGQTDKAIVQVEEVLKTNPDFQTAYLNKGIFLKTAAQDAQNAGDPKKGDQLLADAKAAFTKAVGIDAASDSGKRAAQELQSL